MPHSHAIQFKSERFDYRSELPYEINAGNRFYGKDLAEFIAAEFTRRGLPADFLDEDWGWLVFSQKGSAPEFEVAIYNLSEHSEGGRPGTNEWGLWARAYVRSKLLGLVPRRTEVAVPDRVSEALSQAVRAAGSEPEPWADGPQ